MRPLLLGLPILMPLFDSVVCGGHSSRSGAATTLEARARYSYLLIGLFGKEQGTIRCPLADPLQKPVKNHAYKDVNDIGILERSMIKANLAFKEILSLYYNEPRPSFSSDVDNILHRYNRARSSVFPSPFLR